MVAFVLKFCRLKRTVEAMLGMLLGLSTIQAWGVSPAQQAQRDELLYGTVLYEFYQRDFFKALVADAWVRHQNNPNSVSGNGKLLQGGMQISYGIPDSAEAIFRQTLRETDDSTVRNTAWFYLSKLYHAKSDMSAARASLAEVQGAIHKDLRVEYHYLRSLLHDDTTQLEASHTTLKQVKDDLPEYPYILFNFAILALQDGDSTEATKYFEEVQAYTHLGSEYENLADRAKHALAILASEQGDLLGAWEQLSTIRTTGLYSNRALLSYAWTAIKLNRHKEAIPALKILDSRSIALPEVQEGKVLLAHLYEQDQAPRKALKQNVIAEKEFKRGLLMLEEAERIIGMKDVPKEFIANLDNVVRETDWYGERPEVDYRQLTPFLIDLLAAHNFNETLRELGDLYALRSNLEYWLLQQEQHLLILAESEKKSFSEQTAQYIESSEELSAQLTVLDTELRLMLLALEQETQDRFQTQLDTTESELRRVEERLVVINSIKSPYRPPAFLSPEVERKQAELTTQLEICNELIERLEKIVRGQVKHELDRHRSRMTYYAAQARLAKARLYDATLQDLNSAKRRAKKTAVDAGEQIE